MALRFLADHCVSNFTVRKLQDAQHEVLRLREVLPVDSPDSLVIAKAQDLTAILLSLNGDFSDIVRYPPKQYLGIVALQLRNHAEILPPLLMRLISYLSQRPSMSDYRGKLLLVEVDRIRVRE